MQTLSRRGSKGSHFVSSIAMGWFPWYPDRIHRATYPPPYPPWSRTNRCCQLNEAVTLVVHSFCGPSGRVDHPPSSFKAVKCSPGSRLVLIKASKPEQTTLHRSLDKITRLELRTAWVIAVHDHLFFYTAWIENPFEDSMSSLGAFMSTLGLPLSAALGA
jgi:hypothetical protein